MSLRLALVAVVIALLLGAVLALVQRGGGSGSSSGGSGGGPGGGLGVTEDLAEFDAGRVVSMVVEREGQPPVTVRRSRGGAWSLAMEEGVSWPVVPENPINLLRGLRTLRGQRPGDLVGGSEAMPEDAVRLTLSGDLGDRTTFAFDPAPVGGRIRAWANERGPYLVGDEILIALTDPGPIGWRIPRVFPGLSEFSASRVTLSTDEHEPFELVRLAGQWQLVTPVRAEANQEAAVGLLRVLASLQVSRFMPATEALVRRAETEPAWRIGVRIGQETDVALNIWGALEPSGSILLGAVRTGDDGPMSFLAIPTSGLAELQSRASRYLPPTPTAQATADIASLVIVSADGDRRVRLERDLSRWLVTVDDREPRPDTDNHAGQLLDLLTKRPTRAMMFPAGPDTAVADAASAARLAEPEDFVLHAVIELRGLDDGVLEVIRLGHSLPGGGERGGEGMLTALRGQARWDFTEDREPPRAVRMVMPSAGWPGLE